MKFTRNTVGLIPLFFIITIPIWSIPIGKFLKPRGGFDNEPQKETVSSHNFNMDTVRILQNQHGKTTAVIRSNRAQTGDNSDILILDGVDADIFDDNNNITHVVAKKGEYNIATEVLTLQNEVVINRKTDNQYLYTDLLIYRSKERTVNCPQETLLKNEAAQVTGGSLKYDIATQQYVLENRVHCIIQGYIEP